MQADSHMKQIMANEKDPSTPLGMTIREHRFSRVSFHPAEGANLRPFLGREKTELWHRHYVYSAALLFFTHRNQPL